MSATFSHGDRDFVMRLDDAAQAHMGWTHRVLRCAVLGISPGDDVLAEDAHCRCRFGAWFGQCRDRFDAIDAELTRHLDLQHRRLHDAVRSICSHLLAHEAGDPVALDDFEQSQTAMVADLARLKTEFLSRSARIDALTGLPLRYGVEEEYLRCRAQALRHGEHLVVLMMDVDHFKRVNDVHGHAVGDLALQHVADVLRGHCRGAEPLFRFGGEEFLALLQVADRDAAEQVVQRLLQALRDSPLQLTEGPVLGLRLSAGLAAAHANESMADVVDRADKALYAAKAAGRDRWRWAATGP
jgi:diguanylate cyclase (GGDEF)-like protein